MKDRGQLDLWAGGTPSGELRWVPNPQPGWLGVGPLGADLARLRAEHRVSIVVAAVADPTSVLERAADLEMDVRHLAPSDDGLELSSLRRHAAALAADARAGRRVVVLGEDETRSALVVAAALVELGATPDEAAKAAGCSGGRDETTKALALIAS